MFEEAARVTLAQRTIARFELVAFASEPRDPEVPRAIWHTWQSTLSTRSDPWSRLWLPDDELSPRRRPAVAFNAHGQLEIVVLGGELWHARQRGSDIDWVGWNSLGSPPVAGSGIGGSTLAQNHDGRLELFTKLDDGSLWHRWQTEPAGASWHPWRRLLETSGDQGFGTPEAPPVLASNADGRLELFTTMDDGALWHRWQTVPNGGWSAWSSLEAPDPGIRGEPLVKRNADGRLELFPVASDGSVWHRRQTGPGRGPWQAWAPLGRVEITSPEMMAVGAHADGRLVLFALSQTAAGGPEVLRREQSSNNGWSEWRSLGRPADAFPVPAALSESLTGIRFPALARDHAGRLQLWSLGPNPHQLAESRTMFHRLEQLGPSDDNWAHGVYFIDNPPGPVYIPEPAGRDFF
jgi:hypothetical protein